MKTDRCVELDEMMSLASKIPVVIAAIWQVSVSMLSRFSNISCGRGCTLAGVVISGLISAPVELLAASAGVETRSQCGYFAR